MGKYRINIQLLCMNEECSEDLTHWTDIWELYSDNIAGEVICPNCKNNTFSIVLLKSEKSNKFKLRK